MPPQCTMPLPPINNPVFFILFFFMDVLLPVSLSLLRLFNLSCSRAFLLIQLYHWAWVCELMQSVCNLRRSRTRGIMQPLSIIAAESFRKCESVVCVIPDDAWEAVWSWRDQSLVLGVWALSGIMWIFKRYCNFFFSV